MGQLGGEVLHLSIQLLNTFAVIQKILFQCSFICIGSLGKSIIFDGKCKNREFCGGFVISVISYHLSVTPSVKPGCCILFIAGHKTLGFWSNL